MPAENFWLSPPSSTKSLPAVSEGVAFLVHGLSVLVSLAAVERHWIVTQSASCKLECIWNKLRTGLLEASDFQL